MHNVTKKIKSLWNNYWFIEGPTYPLGLFRIVFGTFIFSIFVISYPNWQQFYGPNGSLPLEFMYKTEHLNIFALNDSETFCWVIYWVGLAVSLTFTVGYKTRASCLLLFIIYASLCHRNYYIINGQDMMIKMLLFFCCFAPLENSLSIDEYQKNGRLRIFDSDDQKSVQDLWIVRLMQISIINVYIFSIPTKWLIDEAWRNGTAIYYVSQSERWFRFTDIGLLHNQTISMLATYSALLAELSFVILIWFPKTKKIALFIITTFHIFLCIVMHPSVFHYGLSMVISFMLFLEADTVKNFLNSTLARKKLTI